jgi:hypothetical protein
LTWKQYSIEGRNNGEPWRKRRCNLATSKKHLIKLLFSA